MKDICKSVAAYSRTVLETKLDQLAAGLLHNHSLHLQQENYNKDNVWVREE